jgi:type VI protein secretion system component Hcp
MTMLAKNILHKSGLNGLVAGLVGILLLVTHDAFAASSTYLFLPGIPGGSVDARHPNEIDVLNYTHVLGTKNCAKLVVFKALDIASPLLATYAVTNQTISGGRIEIVKSDVRPVTIFRADLTNITVGTTELVEGSDGSITEKVSLFPKTLTLTHIPQNSDGSSGAPITGQVNCTY